MKELTNEELQNVTGGLAKWAIAALIAGGTFLIGVLDGQIKLK